MKIINLCLILFLGLTACNNSPTISTTTSTEQKVIDANMIMEYVKANNLSGSITPSGIFHTIESEGDGSSAKDLKPSSKLVVHYHGTFLDGKVFDSSVDRGKPFDFKLNQVIPGWQEAMKLLNKGGKGTFIIPSHLAYGSKGFSSLIPPNTVLKFEVELLEFQ